MHLHVAKRPTADFVLWEVIGGETNLRRRVAMIRDTFRRCFQHLATDTSSRPKRSKYRCQYHNSRCPREAVCPYYSQSGTLYRQRTSANTCQGSDCHCLSCCSNCHCYLRWKHSTHFLCPCRRRHPCHRMAYCQTSNRLLRRRRRN